MHGGVKVESPQSLLKSSLINGKFHSLFSDIRCHRPKKNE